MISEDAASGTEATAKCEPSGRAMPWIVSPWSAMIHPVKAVSVWIVAVLLVVGVGVGAEAITGGGGAQGPLLRVASGYRWPARVRVATRHSPDAGFQADAA